nr:signal peptidase II [Pelagicoccus albus]
MLLTLAAAVLLLDQATKLWVVNTLPYEGAFFPPESIEVIPGFFNIVWVTNTGAAWSMFSGHIWPLTAVGFLALGLLFFFRKALELHLPKIQLSYGLIIGGIIGNMIDRIRIQKVIDFLDFHYGDYYFPSFNIADSGITVGVALYIIFSFRSNEKTPEEIQKENEEAVFNAAENSGDEAESSDSLEENAPSNPLKQEDKA